MVGKGTTGKAWELAGLIIEMQHLQKVLIFLTSVLFVIFAVQFGLAQYEYLTWPEPMLGFAVDAAPQYPVALYHAISLLLLVSIIVADKLLRF